MLHDVCNCSDHDPILLHLDVAIARSNCAQQHFRSKPACNRANETQIMEYSNNLRYRLSNVSLPLSAVKVTCRHRSRDHSNPHTTFPIRAPL